MKRSELIQQSDVLMKKAEDVAVGFHDFFDELPEDNNYQNLYKLRYNTSDIVSDVASACGALEVREVIYKLGHARSVLYENAAMIRLAHRLRQVRLQPELMLDIDKLVSLIDAEIDALPKDDSSEKIVKHTTKGKE